MAEPILRVEEVVKDFGEGHVVARVLHGVSFELQPGEMTALIGPSGSGKSTLLNLLGLLDRPTAGRIVIGGEDTTRLDEAGRTRVRNRAIGFIFQFHHLISAFSAVENVVMPLAIGQGRTSPELRRRGLDLLGRVGLGDRGDDRVTELSGGQQQRVAIARALAAEPPLVLADEPTGNLDTHTADAIFELLGEFNRERHMALLVVTHDPRLAARCPRVITLVDGRIVSDERR